MQDSQTECYLVLWQIESFRPGLWVQNLLRCGVAAVPCPGTASTAAASGRLPHV